VVAVDAVLDPNDLVAVAIEHLEVYRNGFTINLLIRVNPNRVRDIVETLGSPGPNRSPRVGIRFADGRTATSDLGISADLPKDERGVPTVPIVSVRSGGGFGGWRAWAWVFPLPPDGPLEILVGFDAAGLDESRIRVDGTAVRRAAGRAREVWT
jgi:hypothetical protein